MKRRFIIQALTISPPGTMGGNSKIAIEMARNLQDAYDVHVIVPESKAGTFTGNISDISRMSIHVVKAFPKDDKLRPLSSSSFYGKVLRELYGKLSVGAGDIVYSCSDFHCDVVPVYALWRERRFMWLPSVYLFVPFIFENIRRRYGFPALKYLAYYAYQRLMFGIMKRAAAGFVVTNESDFGRFPRRFSGRVFPLYGGVNTEQIDEAERDRKERDVVFCSRLHQQKGVAQFLDAWARIVHECPEARLAIIGNGDESYVAELHMKADALRISGSIEWLGYVNNTDKYRIYKSAKIFVHPTVYDNNGMVAAEALCTGLPVVMYDHDALRAVYDAGCVKVPVGDLDAFAEATIRLLRDHSHYARVRPPAEEVAALRGKWAWESRSREFGGFLEAIAGAAARPR